MRRLICRYLGHTWEPARFQPYITPQLWTYECARCGETDSFTP